MFLIFFRLIQLVSRKTIKIKIVTRVVLNGPFVERRATRSDTGRSGNRHRLWRPGNRHHRRGRRPGRPGPPDGRRSTADPSTRWSSPARPTGRILQITNILISALKMILK